MRLNARSLRLTRDHASRRTIVETERIGDGRPLIVRALIAAILFLSELFGPVSLVSLDLARERNASVEGQMSNWPSHLVGSFSAKLSNVT